jgi:hypothetical protein
MKCRPKFNGAQGLDGSGVAKGVQGLRDLDAVYLSLAVDSEFEFETSLNPLLPGRFGVVNLEVECSAAALNLWVPILGRQGGDHLCGGLRRVGST